MQRSERLNLLIWRWQRRAAILLAPVLAFHVIYQYFVIGMDRISFSSVSDKLATAGFLVLDLVLLILVTMHAFAGLRSIMIDYTGSASRIRSITIATVVLFSSTVVYALTALSTFL